LWTRGQPQGEYSYGLPVYSVSNCSDGNPEVRRTPLVEHNKKENTYLLSSRAAIAALAKSTT